MFKHPWVLTQDTTVISGANPLYAPFTTLAATPAWVFPWCIWVCIYTRKCNWCFKVIYHARMHASAFMSPLDM